MELIVEKIDSYESDSNLFFTYFLHTSHGICLFFDKISLGS